MDWQGTCHSGGLVGVRSNLVKRHDLGHKLFEQVERHLGAQGMELADGTIVDSAVISAQSSTKNQFGEHYPRNAPDQNRQPVVLRHEDTRGVEGITKLIYSVVATPPDMHDGQVLGHLLHGDEVRL
jgi:IS5 family transposase